MCLCASTSLQHTTHYWHLERNATHRTMLHTGFTTSVHPGQITEPGLGHTHTQTTAKISVVTERQIELILQ